jgi:hypothetical protein
MATATKARWQMSGQGYEFCNCDFGCGCNFGGFPNSKDGSCRALVGFSVTKGRCGDTDLAGVKGAEGTMTAGTTGSELVSLMLYDQPSRIGVWLILAMDRLTREQKKRILVGCMTGCEAVVRGEVKKGTVGAVMTEIILDDFEITGRR